MIRIALVILSGNAAASLLTLVRTLVIAHMIPVEDFGIAATFAVVIAVVEMASTLGLQAQIVQARDGDDPRFQAALQGFQLLRGLVLAVVLFLLAGPVADFLKLPEVAWAYRLMAVVPILNSLVHLDIHRLNRRMTYGPMIATGVLSNLVALASVWPLTAWFGDWRAMLGTILIQAAVAPLVAGILAERPFRAALDLATMRRSVAFGWSIFLNGMLLFLVFHGDRLIVGRVLGMEPLAIFSMGLTLLVTPALVFVNSALNLFLPLLSKTDPTTTEGRARFQHLAALSIELHLAFGVALVLGAAALGDWLVHLLLGAKYAALAPLLPWIALSQALRIVKDSPAAAILARAHTSNAAYSNLLRIAALPAAWLLAVRTGAVEAVVAAIIVGEGAAALANYGLLRWRTGVRLRDLAVPLAWGTLSCALALASTEVGGSQRPLLLAAAALTTAAAVWSMTLLRLAVLRRLRAPRPA